jgi:beta-phosphoglucomutase-like phosphatase (HAD superfamily)
VVVEDSRIGLQAAKAAGMTCVVTKSSYTQGEDFSSADGVFDTLEDAGDWRQWLGAPKAAARSA